MLLSQDLNITENYKKAVKLYNEKKYENALEEFLIVSDSGIEQADLYFDIGNCYFRLNNLGKAILYYKRALHLSPLHKEAAKNLKLAYSLRKDKQDIEEEFFINETITNFFKVLPLDALAIVLLTIFIFIVLIINTLIIRYKGREKSIPLLWLTIFIVFFIGTAVLSSWKWNNYKNNREAVLLDATAISYSGPGSDYTRLFTIHEGMDFDVEKVQENWSLIKLKNGMGGWIETSSYAKVVE